MLRLNFKRSIASPHPAVAAHEILKTMPRSPKLMQAIHAFPSLKSLVRAEIAIHDGVHAHSKSHQRFSMTSCPFTHYRYVQRVCDPSLIGRPCVVGVLLWSGHGVHALVKGICRSSSKMICHIARHLQSREVLR